MFRVLRGSKATRPRKLKTTWFLEEMPHLQPLCLEVSCIVGICRGFDRELLDNIETVPFKTHDLFRVVRQKSNVAHSQVEQDLCADSILTEVHRIAKLFICFYRVQALLLKFIGADLCGEADSSSLLPHID